MMASNELVSPNELVSQFKNDWGLSYAQLAATLGYSEQGVRQWFHQHPSKQRRMPPAIVIICLKLIDEKWKKEGKPKFF